MGQKLSFRLLFITSPKLLDFADVQCESKKSPLRPAVFRHFYKRLRILNQFCTPIIRCYLQ